MILSVAAEAQQRLYNQTIITVGGGMIINNNSAWMIEAGVEQIIKSSRNSLFGELSYHQYERINDIARDQIIFCPSYGYYLLTGKFLLNLKAGVPLGVEKLKIPSYSSTSLPSSKFIVGMQLSSTAEMNITPLINIYIEPFYQYFFQSLSITNNFGIKLGLKFYL